MASQNSKNIVLPRAAVRDREGVVILDLSQYEKIRRKIEKLEEDKRRLQEEEEILEIITEGEREYRERRIKPIRSLKDLR